MTIWKLWRRELRPRPALFLHTPKTAGTSIMDMARSAYGEKQVASHDDFLNLSPARARSVGFLSGHFGMDFARPHMGDRYSFTFLRDPIDRVVSLYNFCRARDPDQYAIYALAQRTDLYDFLDEAAGKRQRWNVWNNQVLQLAHGRDTAESAIPLEAQVDMDPDYLLERSKASLNEFDYVGFVETFDRDIAAIYRALGGFVGKISHINASRGARRTELPARTIERLEDMTRLDRELYDYAWQRFGRPCDETGRRANGMADRRTSGQR